MSNTDSPLVVVSRAVRRKRDGKYSFAIYAQSGLCVHEPRWWFNEEEDACKAAQAFKNNLYEAFAEYDAVFHEVPKNIHELN